MRGNLFTAIAFMLSLTACGARWHSARPAAKPAAAVATSPAPEIPLPLPKSGNSSEKLPEAKPPTEKPSVQAIESHVWAWASRQIDAGALAAPSGPLNAALDRVAKEEGETVGELASHVTRLIPITQLDSASDALRYYRDRYGIDADFKPVVVAVAPVNRIAAFRKGAHLGAGKIGGVFYVPSRDVWQGPIDREALAFAFGTPYVIFLDESALTNVGGKASSVLVHELKHYLDYRRDPSASPAYAEPAAVSELRARAASPAQEAPALQSERNSAEYRAFLDKAMQVVAQTPDARERVEKKYADYFAAEWRTHLPYLLRPGEVSAFLEQVRFYKYWLNQSESQTIEAMTGADETPAHAVALPPLSLTKELFSLLYRAG